MPPTEPPESDNPDLSASPAKRGRPGVSFDDVADQFDTWFSRTGRAPSVRELRAALGTGSLSTLSRHLSDVMADRLLEGATPDRGSPQETLLKAMKAAMQVLASEAAGAADDVIDLGAREADARIASAEGVKTRALEKANKAEQEREHALGRSDALTDQLKSITTDLDTARTELSTIQKSHTNARETIHELEQSLKTAQADNQTLAQAQSEQQSRLEELTQQLQVAQNDLTTSQAETATAKTSLTEAIAARDAARGTITGMQTALEQAEQRIKTAETTTQQSIDTQNSLRDSLEQAIKQTSDAEKSLAVAVADTAHANRERDASIADRDRLDQIQKTLLLLQEGTSK